MTEIRSDRLYVVILKSIKMLAATLMRQQSRCLQGLGRQVLSPNSNKVPKNSLIPSQYLATTAVNNHGSGDHVKMWSAERLVSVVQIPGLIVPFLWTTPATDALFCTVAVLHSHWGKYLDYDTTREGIIEIVRPGKKGFG